MVINQLTYSRSMRIQLVKFEQSAEVGLFAQCQVDEGEDPVEALAKLKAFVSDNLREDVAALMARRKIG